MRSVFAASLALLSACMPSIARDTIQAGPGTKLDRMKPEVIESSAGITPEWTSAKDRIDAARIAFVGEASAPTLEAAKGRATQDLYAAIASFASVDVESSFQSIETNDTQSVSEATRAHASAELRDLVPDAFYWESFVTSPLVPESTGYQYWVHAWVPKVEIARVRHTKQASREKTSGKRTVAIVPLDADLAGDGTLVANGITDGLARALGASANLRVSDPTAVRASLPKGEAISAAEVVDRLEQALMPDVIVRGGVQRDRDRLKVTLVLHDGRTSAVLGVRTLERAYREAPAIGAMLALGVEEVVRGRSDRRPQKVDAVADETKARAGLAAFEAYHRAYALYQSGANDRALDEIRRAIELAPDSALAYLRLGRILERLGRYAKLPQVASVAAQAEPDPLVCSEEARAAVQKARAELDARAKALMGGAPSGGALSAAGEPWWTPATKSIDDVLKPTPLKTSASKAPEPPGTTLDIPASAAEAYARALRLAEVDADIALQVDADLALADLAVRVDRLQQAVDFYAVVEDSARARKDDHALSLALFGRAVVARKIGRLRDAKALLVDALRRRASLGEKPYVLEIENELAGVAVELGAYAEAEAWYRSAWRLAEDLDIDYLRAVLSNNIGVLDFDLGKLAEAESRFHTAYDALVNVQEAEGKIASGLNLAALSAFRGDDDDAETVFAEIARVVNITAQEGRLAELRAKTGWFATVRAKRAEGLADLAASFLLHQALRRSAQKTRLQIDLLAAEYYAGPTDRARLECLKRTHWQLGAQVFERPKLDPNTTTLALMQTGSAEELDLVLGLNAAAISALSAWVPPYIMWVYRPEPPAIQPTIHNVYERERPATVEEGQGAAEPPRPTVEEPVLTVAQSRRRAAETPPEQAKAVEKQAEYERILGAFTADADVLVFLDPETTSLRLHRSSAKIALKMLRSIAAHFHARGLARDAAVAELDLGALEWFVDDPEQGYRDMMSAHASFAKMGDSTGLAYAYEWLGYFFRQSLAPDLAASQLQMSYALFDRTGDAASAARVLRYGR
jgi:tetratricopeptide (TPR) repeat protein